MRDFTVDSIKMSVSNGTTEKTLTHCGQASHVCIIKLSHHWFREWLVTWPAPGHYLDQCLNSVNEILGKIFQWNFNQNTTIFIIEKMHWKILSGKRRPFCLSLNVLTFEFVNDLWGSNWQKCVNTCDEMIKYFNGPVCTPSKVLWSSHMVQYAKPSINILLQCQHSFIL